MKKFLLPLLLSLPVAVMAQHWTPKTTADYPDETIVYAMVNINGVDATASDALELAAFLGTECRADDNAPATSANRLIYTLRVVGDRQTEENQNIAFRAYRSGIEFEFTAKVPFTGETQSSVNNPLVLNLDAPTAVSVLSPISITQPASAFPYTMDLSSYATLAYGDATPKGESRILSSISYQWSSSNTNFTFSGNNVTVNQAIAAENVAVQVNASFSNGDGVSAQLVGQTNFKVEIATVPVTSITCSVTDLEVNAFGEVITELLNDKVTILPENASTKGFYVEPKDDATGAALNDDKTFNTSGDFVLNIWPLDTNYSGQPAQVNVKAWMLPYNIKSNTNTLTLGVGENVFDRIEANQVIEYPSQNVGPYVKNEVAYTVSDNAYVSATGVALKTGSVRVTVKLVNGRLDNPDFPGTDTYTVTINIESRLSARMTTGESDFVKNGQVSDATPAIVYVNNPGGEPFSLNSLSISFSERYSGYPYAIQAGLEEVEATDAEASETAYKILIKPLFAGNKIPFDVSYNGEVIGRSTINIFVEQNLASGWNWISINNMLYNNGSPVSEVFTQKDIIEIRSQLGLLYNDAIYGYFGSINTLTYTDGSYKVKTNKATVAKMGQISVPTDDAYKLHPGYNWTNNPYEFDVSVARLSAFLSPFTPSEGDKIITRDAFAIYQNGEWVADLNFALKEGEGFVYYNSAATEKSLYHNPNLQPDFAITLNSAAEGNVKSSLPWTMRGNSDEAFQYDKYAYADNMIMVATIDGLDNPENYTLGVFVNDECRGRGRVVRDDLMFVNAVGQAGEHLTFKLMNNLTGEMSSISETMSYSLSKGSLNEPVVLSIGNPTGIGRVNDTEGQENVIYDLSGRRVERLQKGIYIINGKKVLK